MDGLYNNVFVFFARSSSELELYIAPLFYHNLSENKSYYIRGQQSLIFSLLYTECIQTTSTLHFIL